MFGGALWGSALGGVDDHLTKERDPPPRPISPEFPTYIPPYRPHSLTSQLSSRLRHRICHVRSFTDISDADLEELNISYELDVPLSDFVPTEQNKSRPLPFDSDLEAMLTEISVDNQDAFREVLRMPPLAGRTKPRLAYARNFFGSLEDVARYWDNSKDEYYRVPIKKTGPSQTIGSSNTSSKEKVLKSQNGRLADSVKGRLGLDADVAMTDASPDATHSRPTMNEKPVDTETKEVYKGYRISNGEELSPGTRVALVKNLLKMVTHKFQCRDHEPIPAPREKLVIRGVKIQSIQYHFCIARIPSDTKLARSRMVEGPLMAAQVRDEVRFKARAGQIKTTKMEEAPAEQKESTSNTSGPMKAPAAVTPKPSLMSGSTFFGERFDMFREIGALLILAIQREREGKSKDSISQADRWWVTTKRWGGGPTRWGQLAYEIFEDEDPSWSPAERQLQEEKRKGEVLAREQGRDGKEPVDPSKINIDDLMADNAPTLPGVPGDPISRPRRKKLRSLERPMSKDDDPSQFRDGKRLMFVPPFRKKWHQEWTKLRPNATLWDDKLMYKHIGKLEQSDFDDVYMIGAANHHVCLTRMKVHPHYLEWLESGKPVANEEDIDGLKSNVLYVSRSGWYDMLDVEARKEFLIALWSVMSWLNRDRLPQEELDKLQPAKLV